MLENLHIDLYLDEDKDNLPPMPALEGNKEVKLAKLVKMKLFLRTKIKSSKRKI